MYRFCITIALLIVATVANHAFSSLEAELTRRTLSEFPNTLGAWTAVDEQTIGKASMNVLHVDDYIMRSYSNQKGETIGLYIGYFKTQRDGKQVHSPRQCLPGAGWKTIDHREYLLGLPGHNPEKVPINLQLMAKGSQKQVYLWWYQGRGRIYANEHLNKLYLIWDAMTRHRTDGALVRVNMEVASDLGQTVETQIRFISLFSPLLAQYVTN